MKNIFKAIILVLSVLLVISFSGCEKLDEDYGKSMPVESENSDTGELVYPEIKTSDEIMPKYFDVSSFDEENYSNIFLGKKFEFNITYSGSVITVPSSFSKMSKLGWRICEESNYDEDSVITAGKNIEVVLCNEYNKRINAVFYNFSNSSKKLTKCDIVKFIIPENSLNLAESNYGLFWVNGVTNQSAINNIVEYWGVPSHFYRVDANHYYLDYFLSKDNKRSGITVHVDPENDIVLSIEFADYE